MGWYDFLNEAELADAAAGVAETAMYATQNPVFMCRTTCYGGFASAEPYEPMPAWLAKIRRAVELHLGLAYTFFNAAALVCLAVDSDCVDWHQLPPNIRCVASLVLAGTALVEARKPHQLNPAAALQLRAGQLSSTNHGVCPGFQLRLSPVPVATASTSTGKRKETATSAIEGGMSWHLMLMHLPATSKLEQREEVDWLYRTFRYGTQLTSVLREPQLKLVLQVVSGTDAVARQLRLDELFPVKKERRTATNTAAVGATGDVRVKEEPVK